MSTLHSDLVRSGPDDTAARVVDLVNTVVDTPDDDVLVTRLAATLRRQGEPRTDGVAEEVVALRSLLVRLREVLASDDRDIAAFELDDLLERHASRPRLERHDGWDWHLHVDGGIDASWERWLGATAALALAGLLCAASEPPWGECAADDCRRMYLSDGRGATRRFCSSRCGTRERVRRHRSGRTAASMR